MKSNDGYSINLEFLFNNFELFFHIFMLGLEDCNDIKLSIDYTFTCSKINKYYKKQLNENPRIHFALTDYFRNYKFKNNINDLNYITQKCFQEKSIILLRIIAQNDTINSLLITTHSFKELLDKYQYPKEGDIFSDIFSLGAPYYVISANDKLESLKIAICPYGYHQDIYFITVNLPLFSLFEIAAKIDWIDGLKILLNRGSNSYWNKYFAQVEFGYIEVKFKDHIFRSIIPDQTISDNTISMLMGANSSNNDYLKNKTHLFLIACQHGRLSIVQKLLNENINYDAYFINECCKLTNKKNKFEIITLLFKFANAEFYNDPYLNSALKQLSHDEGENVTYTDLLKNINCSNRLVKEIKEYLDVEIDKFSGSLTEEKRKILQDFIQYCQTHRIDSISKLLTGFFHEYTNQYNQNPFTKINEHRCTHWFFHLFNPKKCGSFKLFFNQFEKEGRETLEKLESIKLDS